MHPGYYSQGRTSVTEQAPNIREWHTKFPHKHRDGAERYHTKLIYMKPAAETSEKVSDGYDDDGIYKDAHLPCYLPFLKQNTTEPPFSDEFTLI
uniref:Uncharacterized protein n=1 Tax=Talaromyces marneffei PM1 TaxID=1077442 RepID=A0A093VD30_TALMA